MRGVQHFRRHVFQSDMDQKTRMRGPELANGRDAIGVEMIGLKQMVKRQQQVRIRAPHARIDVTCLQLNAAGTLVFDDYLPHVCARQDMAAERSEERRVGKECRSRWSPY